MLGRDLGRFTETMSTVIVAPSGIGATETTLARAHATIWRSSGKISRLSPPARKTARQPFTNSPSSKGSMEDL